MFFSGANKLLLVGDIQRCVTLLFTFMYQPKGGDGKDCVSGSVHEFVVRWKHNWSLVIPAIPSWLTMALNTQEGSLETLPNNQLPNRKQHLPLIYDCFDRLALVASNISRSFCHVSILTALSSWDTQQAQLHMALWHRHAMSWFITMLISLLRPCSVFVSQRKSTWRVISKQSVPITPRGNVIIRLWC